MLIRMDRILSAEQVRTIYGFPKELWAKVQPCLTVLCLGDDGQPCYLESVVDGILKRLARSLDKTPQPGRPDVTAEIAAFADELQTNGKGWKDIFAACKRRWPADDRVETREQVREHWRRHYGDKSK